MEPDDLVEVTFQGGVKAKIPKADAEAYAAARAKDKSEREDLAKRLGSLEADRKAADDAKKAAEESAALAKLTNKEEFQKALAIKETEFSGRLGKLSDAARDRDLRAMIAAHPKVAAMPNGAARDALVALYSTQLKGSCRFNLESNSLEVVGEGGAPIPDSEGKPKRADAWLAETLDVSPLLQAPASPGSGGDGKPAGGPPGALVRVTNADVQKGLAPDLLKSGNYKIVD
jgi:hypothetical protein